MAVTTSLVVCGTALMPGAAHATRAEVYPRPADGTYEIEGRGFGHGVGMSQYGAMSRAAKGRGARRVLRAYYPHTRLRRAGNPKLTVAVSPDGRGYTNQSPPTRPFVRVAAGPNVRVVDHNGRLHRRVAAAPVRVAGAPVRSWAVAVSGPNLWLRAYAGGAWRAVRLRDANGRPVGVASRGPITFKDARGPILLRGMDHRTYPYRGRVRALVTAPNRIARLNVVSMESYLLGVVPAEMPALWPQAAVRAQAVAARTYAESARRSTDGDAWDICDSTSCQVYLGRSGEHPAANRKIRAHTRVAGKVLTYSGRPITAMYGSSNGGWSVAAGSSFPYLPAGKDRWDPRLRWTDRLPVACVEREYGHGGRLVRLVVTGRDGHGPFGGRPTGVRFEFSNGRTETVTSSTPVGRDAAMRGLGGICRGDSTGFDSSLWTLLNRRAQTHRA